MDKDITTYKKPLSFEAWVRTYKKVLEFDEEEARESIPQYDRLVQESKFFFLLEYALEEYKRNHRLLLNPTFKYHMRREIEKGIKKTPIKILQFLARQDFKDSQKLQMMIDYSRIKKEFEDEYEKIEYVIKNYNKKRKQEKYRAERKAKGKKKHPTKSCPKCGSRTIDYMGGSMYRCNDCMIRIWFDGDKAVKWGDMDISRDELEEGTEEALEEINERYNELRTGDIENIKEGPIQIPKEKVMEARKNE